MFMYLFRSTTSPQVMNIYVFQFYNVMKILMHENEIGQVPN